MQVNGDLCHELLKVKKLPKLTYLPDKSLKEQAVLLRQKFEELTGIEDIRDNDCDLNLDVESEEQKDGYRQIRFTFESEIGTVVPCYLLIPDLKKDKYPVAITLQGHSTGFHNSVGIVKYDPRDVNYQPRGQFAIQAVKRGYVALAIEQRGMGEQSSTCDNPMGNKPSSCYHAQFTGLVLGRTLIGERCWDVSRAIDVLEKFFPVCDCEKIILTGNSGGGTISYYAACFDNRIKISVPSCAFCPYNYSIVRRYYHCSCNIIPSALKYFDMQDLAVLIAPRKLSIVTGVEDPAFTVEGVKKGYETIKQIYNQANASDNCNLIITDKGHWWCEDIVWGEVDRLVKESGW